MPTYTFEGGKVPVPYTSSVLLGDRYKGLLDANPYRNLTYNKSPWQSFLSALGFRTQADAWKENMSVQAAEYDASIAQKAYNEDYDSPQSQLSRMQAAGINPALDPSTIDSGSSSPMPEDPSTPMQSSSDMDSVSMFANGLMNILTTSIGLAGSVQGLERNRLQNSLLATQNEESIAGYAEKMFPYMLPGSPFLAEGSEYDDWSADSWRGLALKNAEIFARGMDKKTKDRFLTQIEGFWNGALGESKSYEEFSRNIKSRFGYDVNKKTYLDEQGLISDIITDELGRLSKEILKLRSEGEKASLESGIAEDKYNEEYYRNLDGALAADVTDRANRFQKANLEMTTILNESLDSIITRIQKASEESGIKGGAASIALSLLGVFRLMLVTQGLPSVSSSSNSSQGFGKGVYQSNGDSFSLGW